MKNRLLEERKRLGLTQEQFAKLGGVPKRTYCDYEYGISEPKASFFIEISKASADVQYILIGTRTISQETTLSPREAALLDNYRHVDDEMDKKVIERTAFLAAKADEATESPQKVVNGNS